MGGAGYGWIYQSWKVEKTVGSDAVELTKTGDRQWIVTIIAE